MQQRMSCKSETESALTARQRSWSCFLRRSYSCWIFFLCSLSLWIQGGHLILHCSGAQDTLRILALWSLIHDSTRLCIDSIAGGDLGSLFKPYNLNWICNSAENAPRREKRRNKNVCERENSFVSGLSNFGVWKGICAWFEKAYAFI